MQRMQSESDDANKLRLEMLDKVIDKQMLIPPKFARYPGVEEVLWRTVQGAIIGKIGIDDALADMRTQIEQIVRFGNGAVPTLNGKPASRHHADDPKLGRADIEKL